MAVSENYLLLEDAALVAQCDVDCYRASGPGGQKRNKTSSAVRLRHRPTGLATTASEDRSQHVNKRRALRRLRAAIAFGIRSTIALDDYRPSELLASCVPDHPRPSILVGRRDPRYYMAVSEILDVVFACRARMRETSGYVGVSTASLVKFLQKDVKLWERLNQMRADFGVKPLR